MAILKNERDINFDVDAYTARLIGRENVSKIEGAILELAKNSYDADASAVCFYYEKQAQSLLIMDNGEGMTEDIIRRHWMTIGNSSKRDEYKSQRGRIKTGAKGIGRFALDRLSDRCQMWTSTGETRLVWDVLWTDFDGRRKLSEVKAKLFDTDEQLLAFSDVYSWKNRAMADFVSQTQTWFQGTGTVFRLTQLHDDWSNELQNKIRWHLSNLLPPDADSNFKIFFFNEDTPLSEAEIQSTSVEQYDYKVSFAVTGEKAGQESVLHIALQRNEFDVIGRLDLQETGFSKEDEGYFHGQEIVTERPLREIVSQPDGRNILGPFSGELYFNKVTASKEDRRKFFYRDITGRKNFTKEFGGIKVYRDNFRVRPYGEYGDNNFDWLELSARRNRQPAAISHKSGRWRVGSEQIMGTVRISRENTNLEDDANRNGLQNGPGLTQLKEILWAVIDAFERDRQYVGRILARRFQNEEDRERELQQLKQLADQRQRWEAKKQKNEPLGEVSFAIENTHYEDTAPPTANPIQIKKLVDQIIDENLQTVQALENEIRMLRTLATVGIITNMFMHEIRTLTNNIGVELDAAYEALTLDEDPDYAVKQIGRAIKSKSHFSSWFDVTIGAIQMDKRKRRTINLYDVISSALDSWRSILEKCGAQIEFHCDRSLRLRAFVLDIENILSNLLSNSVSSFERECDVPLDEKRIVLSVTGEDAQHIQIDYRDTGWGLPDKYKAHPERTLEAFETDKKADDGMFYDDGTGMGMWIIHQIVQNYQGTVDLSQNKTLNKGYHILIRLGGENV